MARLSAARKILKRAEDRARAADAAEQADAVSEEISRLRKENMVRLEQRELLRPVLLAAEDEYAKAFGAAHARDETLANLRGARARLQASLRAVEADKTGLTAERDGMNLIGRQADWGESDDAARRHLLALDDIQQRRTTTEWNEEACQVSTMPFGSASRTVPPQWKCPLRFVSFSLSNAGSAADLTSESGSLPRC